MDTAQDITERIERPLRELLHDSNSASSAARNAWVLYLGLLAYFFVALAGISHKDLLLEKPIELPLLQTTIPQLSFFLFAPLILVLVHFAILLQHVMLSRKLREFHKRMTHHEGNGLFRQHRFRVQLSSYTYAQAIAGPFRSPLLAGFLYAMTWITLGILPLLALLDLQITFLPYHDGGVTAMHRLYVVLDFLVLLVFGVFLRFPEKGFRDGFVSNLTQHPGNFFSTLIIALAALVFSFLVATFPDEPLDRVARDIWPVPVPYGMATASTKRTAFWPTAYLFEGQTDEIHGRPDSVFSRSLIALNTGLVPPGQAQAEGFSLSLRGRDLKYASFDRSDLTRADFTGADVSGASFAQSILIKASFAKARMRDADLRKAAVVSIILRGADVEGVKVCTEQHGLPELVGEEIAAKFVKVPCGN